MKTMIQRKQRYPGFQNYNVLFHFSIELFCFEFQFFQLLNDSIIYRKLLDRKDCVLTTVLHCKKTTMSQVYSQNEVSQYWNYPKILCFENMYFLIFQISWVIVSFVLVLQVAAGSGGEEENFQLIKMEHRAIKSLQLLEGVGVRMHSGLPIGSVEVLSIN